MLMRHTRSFHKKLEPRATGGVVRVEPSRPKAPLLAVWLHAGNNKQALEKKVSPSMALDESTSIVHPVCTCSRLHGDVAS
jgi:hypothetical protein